MVPGAGLEPARCCHQGIFIPPTTFVAASYLRRICGLDFTFTIAWLKLPGRRQEPSSLYTFLSVGILRERSVKLRKYSDKQLKEAVTKAASMRQVLQILDVAPYGGNYDVLRKAIRHFNLDTSHFVGQAWNKGKILPPKQPIEKYLSNSLPLQSHKLRNRLLREGILEHRCANCRNTRWLDQPIPLELDHINGNNKDNRLKNLRLLCPNCHAQTPTYRSKKRSKT